MAHDTTIQIFVRCVAVGLARRAVRAQKLLWGMLPSPPSFWEGTIPPCPRAQAGRSQKSKVTPSALTTERVAGVIPKFFSSVSRVSTSTSTSYCKDSPNITKLQHPLQRKYSIPLFNLVLELWSAEIALEVADLLT